MGARGPEYLRAVSGPSMGDGFRVARQLRGSAVQFAALSVYELEPERVGSFDVVVCGSLLLHLRDPLRALAAIRSVCRGRLLCTNQIDLERSVGPRRGPHERQEGTSRNTQWWNHNAPRPPHNVERARFVV